jgi:hypothetical protein
MSVALKRTFEGELTLNDVVAKYPDVPRLVIIKTDVQRRGIHYTERALSVVDPDIHQMRSPYLFGSRDGEIKPLPESLLLRDGTTILVDPTPLEQNPYLFDLVDGRLALVNDGEVVEFVDLWTKPRYYDLKTSSGIPMSHIASARPQRLNIFQSSYCHFWAEKKECRFCDIVNHTRQQKDELGVPVRLKPKDVSETIREALKEPGRFTGICLTAGSVLKGRELFDNEVDYYIETLQAIGENFATKKFPSELISSAFNERQLVRLYEETGLMSYTSDLEVLGEEKFNWICPGKADSVGYLEWKERLVRAVDIFGRGNVGTGLVGGVELARPYGFLNEDDALRSTLDEAESLAERGVTTFFIVWVPRPGSNFRDQHNPSLDYFVRLASGLHQLRVKYGLTIDYNDYRRCGNHPDTDLSRIL